MIQQCCLFSQALSMEQLRDIEVGSMLADRDTSDSPNFQQFLDKKMFIDYEIVLSSHRIPCHRLVLASKSDFFHTMFQNMMAGSNHRSIEFKEFPDELMKKTINYMYTGKLDTSELDGEELVELLNITKYLGIFGVYSMIKERIKSVLSMENCCGMFAFASQYHFSEVKKLCSDFICGKFKEIVSKNEFSELPKNEFSELPKEHITEILVEYSKVK
jgi:hypothetical protein